MTTRGPAYLHREAAVTALIATALMSPATKASANPDLLGLYVGGGVGVGQVDISGQGNAESNFNANHSALKLIAGIRPITALGAELEYLDFGHPNSTVNYGPADATLKGAAVFGVAYLPVSWLDLYAKAGLARLHSTLNAYSEYQPECVPCSPSVFTVDRTDTRVAAGVGGLYKTGALSVRIEYEYFSLANANPSLVSLGLTWSF
jgi:opacity protein-like surface antigen